jgi:hypothetical protein
MPVAVEYQMASLPIVATPCRGGRDYYLDAETWMLVPPDSHAVADAVQSCRHAHFRASSFERVSCGESSGIGDESIVDQEGGRGLFKPNFQPSYGTTCSNAGSRCGFRPRSLERYWRRLRSFSTSALHHLESRTARSVQEIASRDTLQSPPSSMCGG